MTIHHSTLSLNRPSFLGGTPWKLTHLNSINVVFGRNGSGKSLMLRALRDMAPRSRHYIAPERAGDITFDAGLITAVSTSAGTRDSSQGNFAHNYRQQSVARIQAYYARRGSKRKADIHHDPDDLFEAMSRILPDFSVRVKGEAPFYDLKRYRDDTNVTSVSTLSSGESQLLSLGLDIVTIVGIWELDAPDERMLLVDEPDAHVHPDLQIKLADFLCHISKKHNVQMFIATHSTTLLAALGQFGGADASLAYMLPDKETIDAEPFSRVVKEISAFLGGHLLMGPLFGAKVLLVEGDDDYRVWVQVARSGRVNLCVLPCNGEEIRSYQKTLERVFAALSETKTLRGVALVDGDKFPSAVPEATYVRFLKLNCHETENLYLADEVLAEMGSSWGKACAKIKEDASQYGEKEAQLRALALVDDRQTFDVKPVIHQVAEILDPKKLLWSVRLGKILGKGRPTGMLKEFLGASLVDQFWPQQ